MRNRIDDLNQKEIEQITHRLLLRGTGIRRMKFKKPKVTLFEELKIRRLF